MKRLILVALAVVLTLSSLMLSARTVKGTIKGEGKPLGGVLVTDGYSIVQANYKGEYTLELSEKADFVYIVTPQGYVADFSSGVPQFYQFIEDGKDTYNFNLQKMKGDPNRYAMITMSDPQIDTWSDADKLFSTSLPDIKETASKYSDVQVAGIVLGDITWDVYSHNDTYKDFCRKLGFPIYPVIGNHDYDKYLKPGEGADYANQYKRDFGPVYYAFQLGEAYYIVLSNLNYTGHKGYRCTLNIEDQMQWLERLLRTGLNMGNRLYLCMHAPIKPAPDQPLIEGGERLIHLLQWKFEATFLTGHYHRNSNTNLGGGIWEHNLGALCGNWWTNPVAGDGTPLGYQVFEGEGRNITNRYYKSTGYPATYQFKLYGPGNSLDRPKAVVAKVWNWDETWRVRWYEDGKLMGDMEQFYSYDPDYLAYVNGARVVDDYMPFRHNRFFSAYPSENAKEVKVEVTDHFGTTYTETLKLR